MLEFIFYYHLTKKFKNQIFYLKIKFIPELFDFWMKSRSSTSWKSWLFLSLGGHLIFLWKLIKIIDFPSEFCLADISSELTRNALIAYYSIQKGEFCLLDQKIGGIYLFLITRDRIFEKVPWITLKLIFNERENVLIEFWRELQIQNLI